VRAVVVEEPGRPAAVTSVADPAPGAGEAVVAVRGCGICGTDRHILEDGLPTVAYPLIPGHEPWGEVLAVGAGVEAAVGDLVAIDPSLHCGTCRRCRRGQGNLCERWGAIGGTQAGAWAEYVAVPGANAHVLGEGFPLDCASIIEPVACGLRGVQQLRPQADQSTLIVGGGTMGLILAVLLDLRGTGPLTVVELDPARRALAPTLVGVEAVGPDQLGDGEWELVVDATGSADAIEAALDRVAPGGTFLVFGVASPEATVSVSPFRVYQRELTIVGSMAILGTFAAAVDVVARHADRFRPLLTHTFGLEQFDLAVDALGTPEAVKVTIAPGAVT
jgi:2-desacetyl-2-hydroxyethyl bacteriochlorophyllide A dehydrogenase